MFELNGNWCFHVFAFHLISQSYEEAWHSVSFDKVDSMEIVSDMANNLSQMLSKKMDALLVSN